MAHEVSGKILVKWDPADETSFAALTTRHSLTEIGEEAFGRVGDPALGQLEDPRIQHFVIPEGIESIAQAAFYHSPIETVKFPSSLVSMDVAAFSRCENLTAVDFTDSQLVWIGEDGFYGCKNLKELTLPDSLTTICSRAFCGTGIKTLTLPENITEIPNEAFAYCEELEAVELHEKLKNIGNGAFAGCPKLVDFEFPNSLQYVCEDGYHHTTEQGESVGVLENSIALKKVKFPSGLLRFGGTELKGCSNLEEVTIPKTCTILSDELFKDCKKLKSVVFETGSELTYIGNSTFEGCDSLEDVELPDKVKTVGGFTNAKSLKSITIPDSTTEISERAFAGCTNLGAVSLGEYSQLKTIGAWAFKGCSNLVIALPAGLTIDNSAFEGCDNAIFIIDGEYDSPLPSGDNIQIIKDKSAIQHIKVGAVEPGNDSTLFLSEGMTSLPDRIFRGFENLVSVELPSTITTIGKDAFKACENIKKVTFNGTPKFDFQLFEYSEIQTTTIGPDVKEIPEGMFRYFRNLSSFNFPDGLETIGDEAFLRCVTPPEINIPASVTTIGESAFSQCESLVSISMPGVLSLGIAVFDACYNLSDVALSDELKTIPEATFYDCENLRHIRIPDSVTTIGKEAFKGCSALLSMDIPSVTTIGENAFEGCDKLSDVTLSNELKTIPEAAFYECSSLSHIRIPDSVTTIEKEAFKGCSALCGIIITPSVTAIGENAFADCPYQVFVWHGEEGEIDRTLFPDDAKIIIWSDMTPKEQRYLTSEFSLHNLVRMCIETTSAPETAASKLKEFLPSSIDNDTAEEYINDGNKKIHALQDKLTSLGYMKSACSPRTAANIFTELRIEGRLLGLAEEATALLEDSRSSAKDAPNAALLQALETSKAALKAYHEASELSKPTEALEEEIKVLRLEMTTFKKTAAQGAPEASEVAPEGPPSNKPRVDTGSALLNLAHNVQRRIVTFTVNYYPERRSKSPPSDDGDAQMDIATPGPGGGGGG